MAMGAQTDPQIKQPQTAYIQGNSPEEEWTECPDTVILPFPGNASREIRALNTLQRLH